MARYTVIISPDPESGWSTVICPAMPGTVTEGETREAALDAMRGVPPPPQSRLSAQCARRTCRRARMIAA
jgi:hypothetical protein